MPTQYEHEDEGAELERISVALKKTTDELKSLVDEIRGYDFPPDDEYRERPN